MEIFVGKQYTALVSSDKQNHLSGLREAFALFDRNDDGFLSKDELLDAMIKFGVEVDTVQLDEMFQLADIDSNGLIDFNELSTLMERNYTSHDVHQEIKDLFSLIDVNKDGYLSEKEIRKMMKSVGERISKKDVRKMMKEADKNRDGKISLDEFQDMVLSGNFLVACR